MTWIILGVLTLVAWFLQNVIHEGSHALTVKFALMGKVTSFKPWPNKHNDKWKFASMGWDKTKPIEPISMDAFYTAPVSFAIVWIGVLGIITMIIPTIWMIPFILAPIVDILFWIRGYFWGSNLCDGKQYKYWRNK